MSKMKLEDVSFRVEDDAYMVAHEHAMSDNPFHAAQGRTAKTIMNAVNQITSEERKHNTAPEDLAAISISSAVSVCIGILIQSFPHDLAVQVAKDLVGEFEGLARASIKELERQLADKQ